MFPIPASDSSPPRPFGLVAPVTSYERWAQTARFGDLEAPQLSAILAKLDMGYLDDWSDLCEFILSTDPVLASLYVTRVSRVAQATFEVKPSKFGNPNQAQLAAEFCSEMQCKVASFRGVLRQLLHAIFVGVAFVEFEWARDNISKTNYIRKAHPRHAHRFRYDDKWLPRLFDYGTRTRKVHGDGGGVYGEVLDPRRWCVHTHQEIAGYPNVAGVLRPAIWLAMFSRWGERFYVQALERWGGPFVLATVAKNTPEAVRDNVLTALENFIANHGAVVEEGGSIQVHETSVATSGQTAHTVYLERAQRILTALILGTSDATGPGANGTQGAVQTRAGATMDPRMITDGDAVTESWEQSAFKWLLILNRHKFGGVIPPIPSLDAKTASDEVKTDAQDLAEQNGPGSSGAPPVSSGGDLGNLVGPSSTSEPAIPKAQSRSRQERQTASPTTHISRSPEMTSRISLPSATILAEVLRGASVAHRH